MVFTGVSRWATSIALTLVASAPAVAADLDVYREFKLGTSTAEVASRAKTTDRDMRTLHDRPSLLQEISWRPPYTLGKSGSERDSVRSIVFGFVDDQLFRMVVDYDTSRTEGLTKDDVIASLTTIYGPRSTQPIRAARGAGSESLQVGIVIAEWRQDDTVVALQQSAYTGGFGLVVTSVALELKARQALASAIAISNREAPAREAARVKDEAAAAKTAAEKTRTTNKGTFQP